MDSNKINIETFFKGLININNSNFGKYNLIKIFETDITQEDKNIILKSIELRKLINEVRGVNSIDKYKRRNEDQIDLKALVGEYCLSKELLKIYNNKHYFNYLITTPAVAEMILNRKKQDFEIENIENNKILTFDIKSQFLNNDFNYLTVNLKSFDNMKNKSNFFIVCLIDGLQNNFYTNNKCLFYIIKNDYFEQNAEKILTSNNPKFTPYLKINLNIFKNHIDNIKNY